MKTLSALLTALLFLLIFLSFIVHSTAIYTAMGVVFCIDVFINYYFIKGNDSNNGNDKDNNNSGNNAQ